ADDAGVAHRVACARDRRCKGMIAILAQQAAATAAKAAATTVTNGAGAIHLPKSLPSQLDLLNACDKMGPLPAVILIIAGVIFLMFGFSFYQWLVTLDAAVVGACVGAMIGQQLGGALPGGILGG